MKNGRKRNHVLNFIKKNSRLLEGITRKVNTVGKGEQEKEKEPGEERRRPHWFERQIKWKETFHL